MLPTDSKKMFNIVTKLKSDKTPGMDTLVHILVNILD